MIQWINRPIIAALFFCFPAFAAETKLERWSDWYPLDRGQQAGERALNWWSNGLYQPKPEQSFFGQSTLRYGGVPSTFPAKFDRRRVDYFLNWNCEDPPPQSLKNTKDRCRFSSKTYVEIMSEGTATGSRLNLEHWSRGNLGHQEVYYSRRFLSDCSAQHVRASGVSKLDLQRPGNKAPLIMKLPSVPGSEVLGPPVCALVFRSLSQNPEDLVDEETGTWFVMTRNLERHIDADGSELILATNEYYTANPKQSEPMQTFCVRLGDPRYCEQGHAKKATSKGVDGRLFMAEQYQMRRVPARNRLANGFTRFRWWEWTQDNWDEPDAGTKPPRQVWKMTTY